MNLNLFASEYLTRQRQKEVEETAQEAWKWQKIEQKHQPRYFLWRSKNISTKPIECCAGSCC